MQPETPPSETALTPRPQYPRTGRRIRIAVALVVTWAVVMSVGFAWLWSADQQVIQSQKASILRMVNWAMRDISIDYGDASIDTQNLLLYHDVAQGQGAEWALGDVGNQADYLRLTPEGNTVLQAFPYLNAGFCAALFYQDILAAPDFNLSWLNGTNQYTRYFRTVENLTWSLSGNLTLIWYYNGNNTLDQLTSPAAANVQNASAALFAANPYGPTPYCP